MPELGRAVPAVAKLIEERENRRSQGRGRKERWRRCGINGATLQPQKRRKTMQGSY
jgi:hypothetical protein